MDEQFSIAVSPRHSVRLAAEYAGAIEKAAQRDFVVRTIVKREANGMPLMSAEIVIAGRETRAQFALSNEYPLHFRKTYFPGRMRGDPKNEFECQKIASELLGLPPPIGATDDVFRTCLVPGKPLSALSPFQTEPEERNFRRARELELDALAGQWHLTELAFEQLEKLLGAGLSHGDAELQNFIVCPSPLEILPIDFEAAASKDSMSESDWQARIAAEHDPLLRHAARLSIGLGPQTGPLAERVRARLPQLFKDPERIRREIEQPSREA